MRRLVLVNLVALLVFTLCLALARCSAGWELIVTTDRALYQPGDTVHVYGKIAYNDWWSWGNGTVRVSIGIMGPQTNTSATAPIDDDGRFSYSIVNVQDAGPYTIRVNYRGAGTLVTNSTAFMVANVQNLNSTDPDNLESEAAEIVALFNAFGSTQGKPNWNPSCDRDGNGQVDMGDFVVVLVNFGQHCP